MKNVNLTCLSIVVIKSQAISLGHWYKTESKLLRVLLILNKGRERIDFHLLNKSLYSRGNSSRNPETCTVPEISNIQNVPHHTWQRMRYDPLLPTTKG